MSDGDVGQLRKAAEHAYTVTAFDYARDPVGSCNWVLYWQGWQAAAEHLAMHFEAPDTMMYRSEVAASIRRMVTAPPPITDENRYRWLRQHIADGRSEGIEEWVTEPRELDEYVDSRMAAEKGNK